MRQKHLEFWIEQFNGRVPPSYYAFRDKPNFNKLKLKLSRDADAQEIEASEYFHVIEISALADLQEQLQEACEARDHWRKIDLENKKLRAALERIETEDNGWAGLEAAKVLAMTKEE